MLIRKAVKKWDKLRKLKEQKSEAKRETRVGKMVRNIVLAHTIFCLSIFWYI